MAVDLELAPKQKRPPGEPCCEPVVYPDIERSQAERMGRVAKALGDPIRMQFVDVLRKHAGKVCVCELVPLFDLSQPTVSHHLKVLREAGIVGSERQAAPTTPSTPTHWRSCLDGCPETAPGADREDVERSIPFYTALFGVEPAKVDLATRSSRCRARPELHAQRGRADGPRL